VRGGVLPAALLLSALALALSFAPLRIRLVCFVTLGCTLVVGSAFDTPPGWLEIGFLGCWTSIMATAIAVHLPRGPGLGGGIVLSVNAGVWASAVVALSGNAADILKALPALLLVLPGAWLVARRASIALKVASSWLIAIAILAGALPFLPATPGYLPDHLE
jgi:hypothetical protein